MTHGQGREELHCWLKFSLEGFAFRYLCTSLTPWPQLCILLCLRVSCPLLFLLHYPHISGPFLLYVLLSSHGPWFEICFWTPCLLTYLKLSKFIYQSPLYLIGGLRANWEFCGKGPAGTTFAHIHSMLLLRRTSNPRRFMHWLAPCTTSDGQINSLTATRHDKFHKSDRIPD